MIHIIHTSVTMISQILDRKLPGTHQENMDRAHQLSWLATGNSLTIMRLLLMWQQSGISCSLLYQNSLTWHTTSTHKSNSQLLYWKWHFKPIIMLGCTIKYSTEILQIWFTSRRLWTKWEDCGLQWEQTSSKRDNRQRDFKLIYSKWLQLMPFSTSRTLNSPGRQKLWSYDFLKF